MICFCRQKVKFTKFLLQNKWENCSQDTSKALSICVRSITTLKNHNFLILHRISLKTFTDLLLSLLCFCLSQLDARVDLSFNVVLLLVIIQNSPVMSYLQCLELPTCWYILYCAFCNHILFTTYFVLMVSILTIAFSLFTNSKDLNIYRQTSQISHSTTANQGSVPSCNVEYWHYFEIWFIITFPEVQAVFVISYV